MGNYPLTTFDPEDFAHLHTSTYFSQDEIARLYSRFQRLDRDQNGKLSMEELLVIPEFVMNPLAMRILKLFKVESEEMDFNQFALLLSTFHFRAPLQEKLQLLFKIFDVDEDGVISQEELLEVVREMSGERLTEEEMQVIVDHSFRAARPSEKGIYFSDFYEILSSSPSLSQLTITF